MSRLVAVLGCSGWRSRELHPVCAARLARASTEARPDDAVLLSGRSRGRRRASEAELMAQAWAGGCAQLLVDSRARSTYANAVAVRDTARTLGVGEVVLVTSGWHGRRAAALVRAALRGGEKVTVAATEEQGSTAYRLRELLCWTLVPAQLALLATRAGRAPVPPR